MPCPYSFVISPGEQRSLKKPSVWPSIFFMTWLTHLKIRLYLLVKLETFVWNQIFFYSILQQHLFGIKFCNFQSSNCEYCWTLYIRTAVLSPLQTMIKFPNQLELGLQYRNRNNMQIFIQMSPVLTIWSYNYSKRKGVCMQVRLRMLILIWKTEF